MFSCAYLKLAIHYGLLEKLLALNADNSEACFLELTVIVDAESAAPIK